jgi:hypothetical protein
LVDRPVGQLYDTWTPIARRPPTQAPTVAAPLADKMAYHRTQHTSDGVNVTHQVGAEVIFSELPVQRCGQRKIGSAARHLRPMRGLPRWLRERQHVVLS